MRPAGARFYLNTLRYLQAEQMRHLAWNRLRSLWQPSGPSRAPGGLEFLDGWGAHVCRCRPRLDLESLEGRFRFWGKSAAIDLALPWDVPGLGRSWNYLPHYFDWAPPIAQAAVDSRDAVLAARLCRVFDLWIQAHPPGCGVAWEPYPIALRLVNWLDVLQVLQEASEPVWRRRVLESLYVQAAWLERRIERHLLGTHLLKDAKALLLAGRVFAGGTAAGWRREGEHLLRREIGRQVHADGGHVEPSLMYHCVALEDVLDLLNFDAAAGPELRSTLEAAARRMLDFAAAVCTPAGDYPLLGDASLGAAPSPRQLLEYGARLGFEVAPAGGGMRHLVDSGIAVWRDTRQFVLADVGPIGPPHLAGHGHCDSLSFEWHVDGVPLLVDSGTLSYEPGPERLACRSAHAHNTLEIDDHEQHEIWAVFRVARRSKVQARRTSEVAVAAELVPWHDRRLRVERLFESSAGGMRIVDRVVGPGRHGVRSRLHVHPDCEVRMEGKVAHLQNGAVRARILLPETPRFELVPAGRSASFYCASFGEARPNAEILARHEGPLPLEYAFELRPGP